MAVTEKQLTNKQKECVDYKGQDLLIRGVPGSGKTVVLLSRALKQAREGAGAGVRVRVFTFNKTLAKYARELVDELDNPAIEVVNFHSWAFGALRKVLGRHMPKVIKSSDRSDLIAEVIKKYKKNSGAKSKLLDADLEFWEDEITWIKGMSIGSVVAYEKAERRGRGTAVRTQDRRVVWSVYEAYNKELVRNNQLDWDDFAGKLLLEAEAGRLPEELRSDHVLIDEAQDLQASQLKLLRLVARKSMTIAADEAQKIYKTSFAWRDVGINVLGSGSKRLTTSFRSTMHIIALAAALRKFDPAVRSGAEEAVEYETPSTEGTPPRLHPTTGNLKEEEVVVNLIREIQKQSAGLPEQPTIGLLARQWKTLYRMRYLLEEQAIPFEVIKDEEGHVRTPGVKMCTFHSAKGLEFDHVILCRLNEGIIPPDIPATATAEEREELLAIERRLLYVSMTRAKYTLHITHSAPPSRFISEFDTNLFIRSTI